MAIKNTALLYENGTKKKDEEEEKKYVPAAQKAKQRTSDSVATKAGVKESTLDKIEQQNTKKENPVKPVQKEEPKNTISQEELMRLLQLDTEKETANLNNKKTDYNKTGGTVAAVSAGTKAKARNKQVDFDYSASKAAKEDIANLERDILLAKEAQKQMQYLLDQDTPEKRTIGGAGYQKWMSDQRAAEKEKPKTSTFDKLVSASWNAPDTTTPIAGFQQAVNVHREDTSENKPNESWTDEQRNTFGYYYYKGDLEKAFQYAREVNNSIRAGEKEQALKEATELLMKNGATKAAADVLSVPTAMLSGANYLDKLAQQAAQGYYTESSLPVLEDLRGAFRQARVEEINAKNGTLGEEAGILAGKGLGDLYGVGMGAADSLFSAVAGGKAGALLTAFGGSASAATDDALARGADLNTALGYGTVVGVAELLPEYLSVDSLFKLGSAKSLGGFLKNVGTQAATEGFEGAVSSISAALADEVIMQELSKFDQEVNALMLSGYSREEAEQVAAKNGRVDIILDTLGEAIGGGMSGAAVTGFNNVVNKNATEVPKAFDGNPVTEEENLVAAKIEEIENSDISEAEKAKKMAEIAEFVAETTNTPEVIAEVEKVKNFHEQQKQKELDRAVDVANRLGNVVEFDESIIGNGIHKDDGTIVINPNSKNPVMQILVHELTHDIETSGLYEGFSKKILDFAAEVQGVNLAKMEQMVISDYAKEGIKLDKTLADKEIVAKFAEKHLFTDEKAIERLCNTDPTLFDKIRYWIRDMVAKFRGTEQERFLMEAERLYEKAVATRREVAGAGVEQNSFKGYAEDGKGIYQSNFPKGTPKKAKGEKILNYIKNVWSKKPIRLEVKNDDGTSRFIEAKFDPTYDETGNIATDASKLAGGNRHGTASDQRVTLDLADDYYKIAEESRYNYWKDETGKDTFTHKDVKRWHYFVNDIYFAEYGSEDLAPYTVTINVKEKPDGEYVYSFSAEKEKELSSQQSLHAAVNSSENATAKGNLFNESVPQNLSNVNDQHSVGRGFDELANAVSEEEKMQHVAEAKEYFGKTYNWNETGYITLDGSRLDFSGKKDGGPAGHRSIDHREITDAFAEGYDKGEHSGGLVRFMGEGNIRIIPETGGINLSVEPTKDQYYSLGDFISRNRGEVIVDFDDLNGNTVASAEYNRGTYYTKVINDIKNYFENGVVPKGSESETAQWRYSTGRSFDEMAEEATDKNKPVKVSAEVMESAKRVAQQMEEYNKNRPVKEKYVPQETKKAEPVVDVPQSKKSETFERRYKRRIENGIASVFGVTNADLKGDIRPIIDEIANDIKNNKPVTDEQIARLYKQAFDDGIITEEFPQYESTRRYIRNTPIYVSKVDQDEFGDTKAFREFARSNFGNLKISSDPRSSHLDSFYKSLTEQAPEFFDEAETDPKTQLEDIADFMQQTKKQYYGIDEVYGGEMLADYEEWAKKELRAYMAEFSKGMDAVASYERDRQIKATNKAREMDREASYDAAKAAFDDNKIFNARKAVEKAHENTLLSDNDKTVVKRLLEGTLTEGDVVFQNAGNVEGIIEVYKAEKAYKEAKAPFDRYRIAYKTALQHDAIDLTAVSDEWKDKKIGLEYSRETAERNIKDITKNDYLGGKDIIKEYIAPVHEHEAMKTRWINEMNQRVKDLDFGHMNKYERAYTQMIGENYAYIVNDKITKHDQFEHDALNERIETLLNEHGKKIDKTKCEKAAAGFMDIYKDIHEQWNDERIRRGQEPVGYIEGYFPHFTEQKPENFIQKVFALLGFDIGSSKLPTDIAGRTADRKPQSKYNPFAKKRTTDVTDYDVLKGFDKYVRAVGDNIYHTEDIQKLRVLSDTIRTKYSSEETEKRIEKIRNDNNYSEEDKEVLIADVFKGAPGAYHLSNFVTWLDEYANILAGKKSRGDREAEYQMGREVYDISKALEGRIASNMIGYNASTPIMNLVPLFQATADLSPVDIVSSVLQTGVAAARGNSFISDNSDFITNRFGADSVYKKNYSLFSSENIKDAVDKINDGGGLVMEYVDRIVSESLVRARYLQNIKKGLNGYEAFAEADSWAAGLIADRSLGALPNIFNVKNPVAKALTMFQVESNNQWSYILKDAGKYKWKSEGAANTIAGQIAFWIAMAACNALAKELLGRDNVVPDPIGLTADALEKISNGEPIGDVAYDTAINVVEQTPFVGGLLGGGRVPLSAALPDAEQVSKLFNPEISGNKKGQILLEEVAKPLSYILAPSGAGQLWKTGKGIEQLVKGGAFGMDNEGKEYLKFAQEYDPESIIKTLLFGQYASDAGQKYIDSGFKNKLTAKQTEQMRTAESMGLFTKDEFYDTILGLKAYDETADKKLAILANKDLTAGQKMGLDYILFGDRNKPWDLRDYSTEQAFYESGLSKNEKRLFDAEYSPEEIAVIEKAFKNDRTKAESIEYVAKKLGLSEAEAFKAVQIRSGKWDFELSEEDAARAAAAKDFYNLSEENYLNILNYSKMGMEITNEKGEKEYKSDKKYAVQNIAKLYNCSTEFAEKIYDQVNTFEYSRADIEGETLNNLINGGRYGVEDKGFFVARNVIKNAEGTKDEYGNTVSGSTKAAAIKEIKTKLGCSEEEATIYYLAANGSLAYSKNDLTTAQRKDLEEAVKQGWTEREYIDAINVIKVTGADSKDEIFKALQDAGATYAMAQGFYNLNQNKDYDRQVYFAYGMTNKKQEEKGNYFIKNFGGTAELVTAMFKAGKGKSKKQEYIDAYMSAGATYNQALEFYKLMQGNNKTFNAWYKENYS